MRSCVSKMWRAGAASGPIGGIAPVKRETDNAEDARGTTDTFHAAPEQP